MCTCFPTVSSYLCNISGAKYMTTAQHEAGRQQTCVRRRGTSEDRMKAGKSSIRRVAETADTRRKVVQKQAEAASLSGTGPNTRKRKK